MARSRSIAVAQTRPVRGDVPANLDEHARLARPVVTMGGRCETCPTRTGPTNPRC